MIRKWRRKGGWKSEGCLCILSLCVFSLALVGVKREGRIFQRLSKCSSCWRKDSGNQWSFSLLGWLMGTWWRRREWEMCALADLGLPSAIKLLEFFCFQCVSLVSSRHPVWGKFFFMVSCGSFCFHEGRYPFWSTRATQRPHPCGLTF